MVICECGADAVRVRLLPDPAAVWCMMDETFGTLGWTRRYYFADSHLRNTSLEDGQFRLLIHLPYGKRHTDL